MRRSHFFVISFLASTGCSLVTDLSSLTSSNDSGAPNDGSALDVLDAAPAEASTCTDTTSDPKNCGACDHDCFGGACTASVCQPVTLISGQKSVGQIAVNGKRIVWSRGKGATQTGGLFAADLDGGHPATLFESSAFACGALAIDDERAWVSCTDGTIHQCSIASCSPTTFATASSVRALALDSVGSKLYMSIGTPYGQQTGGYVGFVPLSGGSIARLTMNDQPNPSSIVLASGNVYWVNSGTYTNDAFDLNGGVRRASPGVNQVDTVLDKDTSGTDYSGLLIDQTTAYYGAGASHEVHSVSLLGGSASKFATDVGASSAATSIVGDDAYVYWSETSPTGGISRCEKSCIKPVRLVAEVDALALTQDASCLYWVNGTGEIKRLAK